MIKIGETVIIIDERSHLHGEILSLVLESLKRINFRSDVIRETVDFGYPIGHTHCVEVGKNDEIYFQKRGNRRKPSKMVRHRQPEPCNLLSLVLVSTGASAYRLLTAYIGKLAEPEPWDERAFRREKDLREARKRAQIFWNQHALIEENENICQSL